MEQIINYTVLALINAIGAYIACIMLRIFNKSDTRNKVVEFFSYLGIYVANYFILIENSSPTVILITQIFTHFILSLNYKSKIKSKIEAAIYTVLILFVIEVIVGLLAGIDRQSTAVVDKNTLYLFLSTKIVGLVTVMLMGLIKPRNQLSSVSYMKKYIMTIACIFMVFIGMVLQTDELPLKKVIFFTLMLGYIAASIVALLIYDRRERKYIEQEWDNLRYQHEISEAAFHALAGLKDTVSEHISALTDLKNVYDVIESQLSADGINDNSHAIAEINRKFELYLADMSKEVLPHCQNHVTGNKELDSILNSKLNEAEAKGIRVVHEIMLAHVDSIDGAVINKVLTPLLDAAIEELENGKEKVLYFTMKSNMGPIMIWIVHADEVDPDIRKNNPFVYSDMNKMSEIKRIVKKYHGALEIKVLDRMVESHARLYLLKRLEKQDTFKGYYEL
ncbi:MAG: hypothetical protein LBV33_08475 [Lachnospiraceae bacterium]|jgi:hypothetical protein|nr:hypothetical protein [Lachnospiraceae bacterium]